RAISCEYCPPRSSTSTGRSSGSASNWTTSAAAVIRRVLRDRDVVRVRLAQPRPGDADEARVLHRVDRLGAAVAHGLAQAADDLVDDALEPALVRHSALDTLRHEFLDVLDVALEVPVLAEPARLHRAQRAHAAVLLVTLALAPDHVARRLVGPGQHRAEHHRVGAGCDRLRDVARGAEAAVADDGHAVAGRGLGDVVDRGHLRHADAGDDARRARAP